MTTEFLDQESPSLLAFICTVPALTYHNPRFSKSSKSTDFPVYIYDIIYDEIRYSKKQDVTNVL